MTSKEQNIYCRFNKEQNRLTNFIKSKIGSKENAEGTVQDVFLSFTLGLDDISDLRKSISWIYSVMSVHDIGLLKVPLITFVNL